MKSKFLLFVVLVTVIFAGVLYVQHNHKEPSNALASVNTVKPVLAKNGLSDEIRSKQEHESTINNEHVVLLFLEKLNKMDPTIIYLFI